MQVSAEFAVHHVRYLLAAGEGEGETLNFHGRDFEAEDAAHQNVNISISRKKGRLE
jgi:hypothetical protein